MLSVSRASAFSRLESIEPIPNTRGSVASTKPSAMMKRFRRSFRFPIELVDRREHAEMQLREAGGFHRPERGHVGAPAAVVEKLLGAAATAPGIDGLREPDGVDRVEPR